MVKDRLRMRKAFLAGILFSFLYAAFIVVQQKFVRTSLHPIHISVFSNIFALLIIISITVVFRPEEFRVKHKEGIKYAMLVGLFTAVFADMFVLYGLQVSCSANLSALLRLGAMTTFLLSVIFFKERISKYKLFSIVIAFLGTILIVFDIEHGYSVNLGDLLFLGAVLSFSLGNIINQKASKYLSTLQILIFRFFCPTLILIPIALIFFPISKLPPIGLFAFNGIVMVIGVYLVTTTIRSAGAIFFEVISSLIPVFTIILSYFFFGTFPIVSQIIGVLLVVGSILLFLRR